VTDNTWNDDDRTKGNHYQGRPHRQQQTCP
jgi:hypothetical protein